MESSEIKNKLKALTDEALESSLTEVEGTLETNVYKIYTNYWNITTEQLDQIREQVDITDVTIDGDITLIANVTKWVRR